MTRHEFLAALHEILRPPTYLEVGVQYGTSLNLAIHSEMAIGVDPVPLIEPAGNQHLMRVTSDEFFANPGVAWPLLQIDMAFIDGMHLFEFALRDFCNIERYCHPGSVVVFDDIFPRNEWEARRLAPGDPVLGDWTGDVWKTLFALNDHHPGMLSYWCVDTEPTGVCAIAGFPDQYQPWSLSGGMIEHYAGLTEIPEIVLKRTHAYQPQVALAEITKETRR